MLTLDENFDLGPVLFGNHSKKEIPRDYIRTGPKRRKRPLDAFDLNLCQFVGQTPAFG
jgi:hypothetical protein